MEILDPRTKSTTFLTLRHYNGVPETRERAQCLLEKSEAFMKPQNLWIAAESFKVSLAPNPDGLVYYNVPPDWHVSCELQNTKDAVTQDEPCDAVLLRDVNVQGGGNTNSVEFFPNRQTMLANTSATNYLDLLAHYEHDINHYNITKGSQIVFDGMGANQQQDVNTTLSADPSDTVQGMAYGPHGLDPITLEFVSDNPPNIVSGLVPNQRSWSLQIKKSDHPGLKYTDVKKYISCLGRRLFLLADTGNGNWGREAFRIMGPANLMTADPTFLTQPSQQYSNHVPDYPLYTKNKIAMNKGATVYAMRQTGHNQAWQEDHTTITELDASWVRDSAQYIYVSVWVEQVVAQGNAFPPAANTQFNLLRGDSDPTLDRTWCSETISSVVTCTTAPTHPGHWDDADNVRLKVGAAYQAKLTRFPGIGGQTDPIPTYTPTHFFSLWNTGFGKDPVPYSIGVHPNGGFMAKILVENCVGFSMNNQMRIAMGLNDYMTVPNVRIKTTESKIDPKPLVRKVNATDHTWVRDYSKGGSFDHQIISGEMADFKIVDVHGVIQGDLTASTPVDTLLRDKQGTGDYYKLTRVLTRMIDDYDLIDGRINGTVFMDEDGIESIMWFNPPAGAYVGNSSVVSIGGFSTFASIRIVIPDGLIFSPMLSGRSDARILAELRLPSIDPQCRIDAGFGPGAEEVGVLMGSDTSFFGDVVWNSSDSKQYLPVTSDNPIYRLNVECRLVYRDPTIEPKVLKLGYKDLFEVKLRMLQLQ